MTLQVHYDNFSNPGPCPCSYCKADREKQRAWRNVSDNYKAQIMEDELG